ASLIGVHRLVRGARRGSVVQVRAHPRMLGVGGIDHRDAEVLLQRSNTVRSIVGAVTGVRRSILRKCSFKLTLGLLAHEFQIAVVGAFGIAAETLLSCGLTLQPAFGVIPGTTDCLASYKLYDCSKIISSADCGDDACDRNAA